MYERLHHNLCQKDVRMLHSFCLNHSFVRSFNLSSHRMFVNFHHPGRYSLYFTLTTSPYMVKVQNYAFWYVNLGRPFFELFCPSANSHLSQDSCPFFVSPIDQQRQDPNSRPNPTFRFRLAKWYFFLYCTLTPCLRT